MPMMMTGPNPNPAAEPVATKRLNRDIDGAIVMRNDGVHWVGTFGVVVDALLRDLVPEGPIDAEFTFLDDDTDEKVSYSARIVKYNAANRTAVADDGAFILVHDICAVAV